MLLFVGVLGFVSCEKNQDIEPYDTIILKVISNKGSIVDNIHITELEVNIVSTKPMRIESEFIKEVKAINADNNLEIVGYIHIPDRKKSILLDIHDGWSFDGRCFIYGTYVEDNGVSIFFPNTDITTRYLMDVCPREGEAFAIGYNDNLIIK